MKGKNFWKIDAAAVLFIMLISALVSCSSEKAHPHGLEHFEASAATCSSSGNTEYWYCGECGEYFSDGEGKNKIDKTSVKTEKLEHVPSDKWGISGATHYRECALCGMPCEVPQAHLPDENGLCVCGAYMMSEGFEFLENEYGGYTLISYSGADAEVKMPTKHKGKPINIIGEYAFSGSGIVSVTLSDEITVIEKGAFENCTRLAELVIPENVVSIGERAFAGCSALSSVSLPTGLREISKEMMRDCGVSELVIPEGIKIIRGYAFYGC